MQKYWKEFFEKHGYTVRGNDSIFKKINDELAFDIKVYFSKEKYIFDIFLSDNEHIRGRILNALVKEPFVQYEEFLKKCWLDLGQELYLDFEYCIVEFYENMINNAFEELGLIPGTIFLKTNY